MAVPFTITLRTSIGTTDVWIESQALWDQAWAESTRRLALIGGGASTPDEVDRLAAVIYLDLTHGQESPIWQQLEPALQEIADSHGGWSIFDGLPSLTSLTTGLAGLGSWALGALALIGVIVWGMRK
jgi:hypothetical protein